MSWLEEDSGRALGALLLGTVSASADTIKVGIIGPFSGPFALQGKNFQAGVEAFMALNGKTVKGHDVEVIYRDLPGRQPCAVAGAGAGTGRQGQGAVSRRRLLHPGRDGDHAAAQAGQHAAGDLQCRDVGDHEHLAARGAHLVHHRADHDAARQGRRSTAASRRSISAVSDYGPGVDAEVAFKKAFEAAGGQVVEAVRMPLNTNDFSPIMQRVRDSKADAVFAFLPSGPTTLGFVKAYNDTGLKQAGVKFLAPGDLTQESDLPALGDGALGLLTIVPLCGVARQPGEQDASSRPPARRSAPPSSSRSRPSAPMTACTSSTR